MDVRTFFKTLSISGNPAAQSQGSIITVDLGKYYSEGQRVRIVQAWARATYHNLSAGYPGAEADTFIIFSDLTTIQIPAANVTETSGTFTPTDNPYVPGPFPYTFKGDLYLTSPIFTFSVTCLKRDVGVYPPSYQFDVDVLLQFEYQKIKEITV